MAGFAASSPTVPVVTELAVFAGDFRPQPPGARSAIPEIVVDGAPG